MRRGQYESFVRPFRCLLAYGFLLLFGASPPRIENMLEVSNLKCNNLIIELALSMSFDTIYVYAGEDNELFKL